MKLASKKDWGVVQYKTWKNTIFGCANGGCKTIAAIWTFLSHQLCMRMLMFWYFWCHVVGAFPNFCCMWISSGFAFHHCEHDGVCTRWKRVWIWTCPTTEKSIQQQGNCLNRKKSSPHCEIITQFWPQLSSHGWSEQWRILVESRFKTTSVLQESLFWLPRTQDMTGLRGNKAKFSLFLGSLQAG